MCGMCGAFAYRTREPLDLDALRRVRDHMAMRGPDASGEWLAPGGDVWFGHRRLSIIDLSERAGQPMLSHDGAYVITFNGEIYNYRALREDLLSRGAHFRTTCDTEVILELYRRKGPDCVEDLRGMFAFGLWDVAQQRLLLARDAYGIKPLYYADIGGRISFASTVKSLLHAPGVPREPDPVGVAGFLTFGSVSEPQTVWKAIRALPAGCTLLIDCNGPRAARQFYSIPAILTDAERLASGRPIADAPAIAQAALLDSVRHHLVADVPVGAFLSAGVDSGSIVGLMRDVGQSDIRTVTLSYAEFAGAATDEAPLAANTARLYATTHTERRVSAAEFRDDLPNILEAMDQPSVDGINTWFVSKAAREMGLKVAISGVGGDELFGGYSTFRTVPSTARWLRAPASVPGIAPLWERIASAAAILGVPAHPKIHGLLRYGGDMPGAYLLHRAVFLPSECVELAGEADFLRAGVDALQPRDLLARTIADGPRSAYGRVAALEACFYLRNQLLRDADWAGMAHSLEIRTPLVDQQLLTQIAPLMVEAGGKGGKALLANAPSKPLPRDRLTRARSGFGVPMQEWLQPLVDGDGDRAAPWARRWALHVARAQDIMHEPRSRVKRQWTTSPRA